MSSRSTICLAVMGLAAGVFGSGAVATLIEHAVGASHAAESRADVPHFNGPYAADLAQAWQESDSLFVRGRWIHMLRTSMSTNPQNLPIDELMTECLIRNRAVSPDYTAEQFAEDNPAQTIPFLEGGTAIFWACNDEPLYTAKLHR